VPKIASNPEVESEPANLSNPKFASVRVMPAIRRPSPRSVDDLLEDYTPRQPTSDQLENIRKHATLARQFELDVADLEARLQQTKSNLNKLYHETLPDLMTEAGIDHIGLPAEGNRPAVDLTLEPFYRANIAASWPEEQRELAFSALRDLGHDDLIKTEITTRFSRDERSLALKVLDVLRQQFNLTPALKENVHPQTLTAWLREQFEANNPLPPLDIIGGTIGRIAKFKERRERL